MSLAPHTLCRDIFINSLLQAPWLCGKQDWWSMIVSVQPYNATSAILWHLNDDQMSLAMTETGSIFSSNFVLLTFHGQLQRACQLSFQTCQGLSLQK